MMVDKMAEAVRAIGLDPVIDKSKKIVMVVYELLNVVCYFDKDTEILSMVIVNRSGFPEGSEWNESRCCHILNANIHIGKCFIDESGDLLMVYQSRLLREEDTQAILKDGLGCLSAMRTMYIRMIMDSC